MIRKFLLALLVGGVWAVGVSVGCNWDRSSLEFVSAGWNCLGQRAVVFSLIKNSGDGDMEGPVLWELHFDPNRDPNKNFPGEIVTTGMVPALKNGEEYQIVADAEATGHYSFRAEQRPGHPGTGELWVSVGFLDLNQCCLPSPETCNGLDDDCDGLVDEDFPLLGEDCRIGDEICGGNGKYVCKPDHSEVECNATPLPDGTSCQDSLFCNGEEFCQQGYCLSGIPPEVDDSISCTLDSCDEITDSILHIPDDTLCPSDYWKATGNEEWLSVSDCLEKKFIEEQLIDCFCDPLIGCSCRTSGEIRWQETAETRQKPDGTPCTDDGIFCTQDYCFSGLCGHFACDDLCPPDEISWTGRRRWEPDEVRPDGLVCTEKELAERQVIDWFCDPDQGCLTHTPYFEWLATGATRTVDNDGDGIPNCDDPFPDWALPLPGEIVINEIAWAGTRASPGDEWIELFNTSFNNYQLEGCEIVYKWRSDPESWERIPLEGTIMAQDYYLIEPDFRATTQREDLTYPFKPIPDEGTTIYLECGLWTVDIVNPQAGPWPAGDQTEFRSMERDHPFLDRWHTFREDGNIVAWDRAGNPILGTPGWPNSQKRD